MARPDTETPVDPMEATRAALTEKVAALERQLRGTVETVRTSAEAVRKVLDVPDQVRANPLVWVGAAAAGFAVGFLLTGRRVSAAAGASGSWLGGLWDRVGEQVRGPAEELLRTAAEAADRAIRDGFREASGRAE